MKKPTLDIEGPVNIVVASDSSFAVTMPIRLKRNSGRRVIKPIAEENEVWGATLTPLQLALARGYRWLRMVDTGQVASLTEIARMEKADPSYIARMVNLTLLAPDLVAAILEETLPNHLTLNDLAINPPVLWSEQRQQFGIT